MVRITVGAIDVKIFLYKSLQTTIEQKFFRVQTTNYKNEDMIEQPVGAYGLVTEDRWFESQ